MNQDKPDDPGRRLILGGLPALFLTTNCGAILNREAHRIRRQNEAFAEEISQLRQVEHSYAMPTEQEVNNTNFCRLILQYEHRFRIPSIITEEQLTEGIDRFNTISEAYGNGINTNDVIEALAGRGVFEDENHSIFVRTNIARITAQCNLTQLHSTIRAQVGEYESTNYVSDVLVRKDPNVPNNYDCDTYSAIALGVAEEYRLPFRGIIIPRHVFLRFECDWLTVNYDQSGGIPIPTSAYRDGSYSENARPIPQTSLDQEVYLRSINLETGKTELVANYLACIANSLLHREEYAAALDLSTLATEWAPLNPLAHSKRAFALLCLGYCQDAREEANIIQQLDPQYEFQENFFPDLARHEQLAEYGLKIRLNNNQEHDSCNNK